MTSKVVRCEMCQKMLPIEECKFATYTTVVDGRKYIFCCEKCAQRHMKKTEK